MHVLIWEALPLHKFDTCSSPTNKQEVFAGLVFVMAPVLRWCWGGGGDSLSLSTQQGPDKLPPLTRRTLLSALMGLIETSDCSDHKRFCLIEHAISRDTQMCRFGCQRFTKQKSSESIFLQTCNIDQYQRSHIDLISLFLPSVFLLLNNLLYCLYIQCLETSVASTRSLIKRHSVCLILSLASSSKYSLLRSILSKSRLPLSLSSSLPLSTIIYFCLFSHQPPISASNIINPHCLYSGRLLFLMQPHPNS